MNELTDLQKAIMSKEGCSLIEANGMIEELREEIRLGGHPEEVLYEFGLEPDYVFDLINPYL